MKYKKAERHIIRRLEKELPKNMYYHGLHHTLDVLDATIRLAKMENISREETLLLNTAALYHDSGFIEKYFLNEEVGARIAKTSLVDFGYSSKQIKMVCDIIVATKIESEPANKLEEIIRDADLDYLGRADFYRIANTLKEELYEHGMKYNEEQWKTILIDFLTKHRYYTESAKKTREATKQKHIEQLKNTTL